MNKDFLGNEINIGDEIVFIQQSYRSLQKGMIEKITKQRVFIRHSPGDYGTIRQSFDQIIKIK